MRGSIISAVLVLAATAVAEWSYPHTQSSAFRGMRHLVPDKPNDSAGSSSKIKNSTFTQPIDHSDPSLGTFEQWYMYDTTYWKGPGYPVVLFTPGEVNASLYTNYLVTNRTTGVVAKEIGAATIVIEHRYWGYSSPYTELTTANLQYLTLENAIADFVNFAENVELPFAKGIKSNAADVPWLMMGGSYSGALAAWTESVSPGTFWAYLCSSGPVQAISNYYGYFLPVELGMPKNCSKDVSSVVKYLDKTFATGSAEEINALKTKFGLQGVKHNDDFMYALENGPYLWQGNQFYENEGFFDWCDYIENAVNVTDPKDIPGADGVGLEKALDGYAKWAKEYFVGYCESYGYYQGAENMECFNTYNASSPIYTDLTLGNTGERQWTWMLCNQPFGYWQDGSSTATIVSTLIDVDYFVRQCGLYFPRGPQGQTYGIAKGATEAEVNAYTSGWELVNTTRLVYTNGGFDPWRESGVSSSLRPGGPLQSTAQVPVNVVPGGFHTSDLITENGVVNAGCKAVIDAEVKQLVEWVKEWPGSRGGYPPPPPYQTGAPPPYQTGPPWQGGRVFRA